MTVRHTPFTAIDAPIAASESTTGAEKVMREESEVGLIERTEPVVSIIPVNMAQLYPLPDRTDLYKVWTQHKC